MDQEISRNFYMFGILFRIMTPNAHCLFDFPEISLILSKKNIVYLPKILSWYLYAKMFLNMVRLHG
jgi:hypothetical protein